MSWNYRIFKQDTATLTTKDGSPYGGDPFYFIGECYYDDNGKPTLHSEMSHNLLSGETPDEVGESLKMVSEAFNAPVIELDEEGNFKESKS